MHSGIQPSIFFMVIQFIIHISFIRCHQIVNIGLEPKKPQLGSVGGPWYLDNANMLVQKTVST